MSVRPSRSSVDRLVFTPAEAVEALGLKNLKQFYRLVEEGHIPVVRMGRLLRVPRASLEARLVSRSGVL